MLYKIHPLETPDQLAIKSMPSLDFREALSTPEERVFSPAAIPVAVAASFTIPDSAPPSVGRLIVRLSRSGWTNIVFVAIASVGGLVCGFYFFNGMELVRAAADWPAEFLYPRPIVANANAKSIEPPPNAIQAAAEKAAPAADTESKNPVDRDFSQSDLAQPATAANATLDPVAVPPPAPGPGSLLDGLNLLPPGADAIFQSFYQTAVNMAPKPVTRTVTRMTSVTRKRVSNSQQKVAIQPTTTTQTARSMSQSAAMQTQTNFNSFQLQNQMHGGLGGGGLAGGVGGGLGAGAVGSAGGTLGGLTGGVLGHH